MTDKTDTLRLLEALIFASDKPLQVSDMMKWFEGESEDSIHDILKTLRQDYEGRGITLCDNGGFWSFKTATDLGEQLNMEVEVERKLSRAALETLAIVAYHQPLTRAEIENIRGVATGKGTLDILIESGWVKPGRRRETPGRPLTWVTTSGFLNHFGLETITDLPGVDELKSAGLLDRRPALQTVLMFEQDDEEMAG